MIVSIVLVSISISIKVSAYVAVPSRKVISEALPFFEKKRSEKKKILLSSPDHGEKIPGCAASFGALEGWGGR